MVGTYCLRDDDAGPSTTKATVHIETERLRLERISGPLAARIVVGARQTGDAWHEQYPWVDELDPLRVLADDPAPDPVFTLWCVDWMTAWLSVGWAPSVRPTHSAVSRSGTDWCPRRGAPGWPPRLCERLCTVPGSMVPPWSGRRPMTTTRLPTVCCTRLDSPWSTARIATGTGNRH
jgi:hypothetical protein